jgi:hypothetical protein
MYVADECAQQIAKAWDDIAVLERLTNADLIVREHSLQSQATSAKHCRNSL